MISDSKVTVDFEAYKELLNKRVLKVPGTFKTCYISDIHKNNDQYEINIILDLASIDTSIPLRDSNIKKHLFELADQSVSLLKIVVKFRYSSDDFSNKKAPIKVTISSEKTNLELNIDSNIEQWKTSFGTHISLSFLKNPLSFSISELNLPYNSFITNTGKTNVLDKIEIVPSFYLLKRESNKPLPHVLIAGAGIAGLVTAHYLCNRGFKVSIYEKNSYAGGKMSSYIDDTNGYTVEHGIHGIFPAYKNFRRVIKEFGYESSSYTKTKTTGMVGNGKVQSFTLARVKGIAPFFLLRLIPKGIFSFREIFSTIFFMIKCYSLTLREKPEIDMDTFSSLLDQSWTPKRIRRSILQPYIRNLSYARGEEVSGLTASKALSYYLLEHANDIKADWVKNRAK